MQDKMGFGGALVAMHRGYSVRRTSWKKEEATRHTVLSVWHIGRAENPIIITSVIGSDSFREWVGSSADLLAGDWETVASDIK